MYTKKGNIIIDGKVFSRDQFKFLLDRFKEAFSHSSLTVEQAFSQLEDYKYDIGLNSSKQAYDYYQGLPEAERKKIALNLHYMILYLGSLFLGYTEKLPDPNDVEAIEELYNKHYSFFENYIYYLIVFDDEGHFDSRSTFDKLAGEYKFGHAVKRGLFDVILKFKNEHVLAHNMKSDHVRAFEYALGFLNREITIMDAIEINKIVNASNPDKEEGFKMTNNDILSASFTPTDKELVPIKMQELFADYKNNFGLDIKDPSEPNITVNERIRRNFMIFRREAIFHIRFERIHPFQDGNGRTGRIILNHNLIRNHLAPVLITDAMSSDYKRCINEADVEGLAKLFSISSSQQLTNWISLCKGSVSRRRLNPDDLSSLFDFDSDSDSRRGRK